MTAFLVLATALTLLDAQLWAGFNEYQGESQAWYGYANEAWALLTLLSLGAVWLWSKSGVLAYMVLTAVGPAIQALHGTSVNWLSVAAILALAILVRPHWRTMPWGLALRLPAGVTR